MKKSKIEKHVNINLITLLITIFVVAILDLLKIYTISPMVMIVFLVGYSIYIIISTFYLINKNYNIDSNNLKKEKSKKQEKK